jgi:serine phosphatase RsbU (regulator of sigma subunit)
MEVWGGNQAVDSSVHLAGLDAWVYSKPYEGAGAGGDVYYVSSCATGRITRLLVADVSGHGVGVADLAEALRQLMRQHVNHLELKQFVASMNREFAARSAVNIFATAVVTTYFAPTSTLTLCNAGHPPPLIYRAATRQWQFLDHEMADDGSFTNFPLGIMTDVAYQQLDVTLDEGDLVLCYTDSLMEILDDAGQQLNLEGLRDVVQRVAIDDAATLIPRLLNAIETRCGHHIEADDATLMLFRPNPLTANPSPVRNLVAPFKVAASLVRAIRSGDRAFALPEMTVVNLGGAIIPSLSRRRRKG